MKNIALREMVAKLKEKVIPLEEGPAKGMIIQHLSDAFYDKEKRKQKRNKVMFSETETNITR